MLVYIQVSDPFIYEIQKRSEVIRIYGEGFLEEYGIEIPDELLREYEEVEEKFWIVQKKITSVLNNNYNQK